MARKKKKENNDPDNGRFVEGNQAHALRENPGRKKKLPRFLEVFKCVLEDPHPVGHAVVLTDEDLLALVNERLEEKERISPSTLSRWKTQEWMSEEDEAMASEFRSLYRKALIRQKLALFDKMTQSSESRSWGRWSWIIERKFDDWNLRQKSIDETPDKKQLVFRVAPEGDNKEEED